MNAALIVVDIQNDFLPGGALAVPEGDQVAAVANRLMARFKDVIATQDWHPADHGSFAANHPGMRPGQIIELAGQAQVLWPVHCVRGTTGAAFAPGLNVGAISHVVRKGQDPQIDSYSGFFDNGHRQATGMADYLAGRNIKDLYILGLATDYCVKATCMDAMRLGYRVTLIEDGCRGVNLHAGDVARALAEMLRAGVRTVDSGALLLERNLSEAYLG